MELTDCSHGPTKTLLTENLQISKFFLTLIFVTQKISCFYFLQFLFTVLSLEGIKCSIDGTFSKHRQNGTKPGEDPCNPLYWYPQNIPEYCNFKKMPTPPTDPGQEMPIPMPLPVPMPLPLPIPMPEPLPILPAPVVPPIIIPPPPAPHGPTPPIAVPHPIMPLPIPLPFGIPLAPTNPMVPVVGIPLPHPPPAFQMPPQYPLPYPPPYGSPYPSAYPPLFPSLYSYQMPPRSGMGMVPGISGLVSPDGGINIMPFSDAYSDMLENHKQKMVRRRLQKFLSEYERPPWKSRRKTRRQNGHEVNEDKYSENMIE